MRQHMKVSDIRFVGDITGNEITGKWDVSGTDLGVPVYSPSQRRMYFLFGDTFGIPGNTPGKSYVPETVSHTRNWRGTIAGYITDFDVLGGLRWAGFLDDESGFARALIPAHYRKNDDYYEVTKISQGGVEVDGTLYVFYESIRHWGPTGMGFWDVNFGGVIKSTDGGATFQRVPDLTWAETDRGEFAPVIKELALQDMNNQPTGGDIDLSVRVAPGFGQMFALDGKDGYIYIYGRHGGRKKGIKAGRVKRGDIERFAAYEYLTGFEGGEPVWVRGAEGLRVLLDKGAACDIIQAPTSNMAVSYNAYLEGWLLTYYKPEVGIFYVLSDTPYGPFTEPEMMLPIDHPILVRENPEGGNRLYAGFTHELLNREQGRKISLIISQWYNKFYNSKLLEITMD